MASIQRRPGARGTTWRVLYRSAGRQTSRSFATEKAAQRHAGRVERLGPSAAERILDAEAGHDPERVLTVAEAVQRHVAAVDVGDPTRANYAAMAQRIAAMPLGHMPLDVADRTDVQAFVAELGRTRAEKTVRNYHALLSAALSRAVDDGLALRNVAHKVRVPRQAREEMCFLTPAEFDVLLGRVTAHYRPLIMWLYGTGMRLGEATAIRVGDVHLEQTPATVTVTRAWKRGGVIGPPKTAAGRRTLSIPRQVVAEIAPLMDRPPGELLFTNTAGRRVLQASLHDLWQGWIADVVLVDGKAVKRMPALGKVPRIHDLRHSHAAAMLASGISTFDLSRRLGHSSINVTADIYGHLMPEAQVQAERAASLLFDPGRSQERAISPGGTNRP